MQLIKCYISSFGKIKDFTFDFSGGLNTIKEDNGWGKTTLSAFIKTMFYGIDNGRKELSKSDRKKYKPWNSTEKFGGFIEFLWGEGLYRLERYFGSKESEDTVRLFDLKTGKESLNTANLGERLFKIDEQGFLSTVYLAQNDFEITDNASITAKFNSLFDYDSSFNYENAIKSLTETAKEYKKTGGKGKIPETQQKIFALNDDIERLKSTMETYDVVKSDIEKLKSETESLFYEEKLLNDELEKVSSSEAVRVKKERYNSCLKEREELTSQKEKILSDLNGNIPTEKELEDFSGFSKELNSTEEKINLLKSNVENLKNTALNGSKTENSQTKKYSNAFISSMFLFFTAFIVFASIFISENSTLGIVFYSLGVLFGAFALFLFLSNKKGKNSKENSSQGVDEYIVKQEKELSEFIDYKGKLNKGINEFLSRFNLKENDPFSAISLIRSLKEKLIGIEENLKKCDQMLNLYAQDKDVFLSEKNDNVNKDEIVAKLNEIRKLYTAKTQELAKKKAEIVLIEERVNLLFDAECKRTEEKENLEKYQKEYDIISKTLEFLSVSDENLRIKYREPLEKSFRKYLSLISEQDFSNANIDVDMKVSLTEKGGEKESDYFSTGYRDLFEICKRFALIDVLFTAEKPFIILDDPFCNLDDKKIKNATILLSKLSESYQIIYLICHESRRA